MLPSDHRQAALDIKGMFTDARVRQFWDPNRRAGTAYVRDVYPTYLKDVYAGLKKNLPKDHPWHESTKRPSDVPPEKSPLWDVAFFYAKGVAWKSSPPKPDRMVKQILFYGEQDQGPSGMFFSDFSKPPFETDWFVELTRAMTELSQTKR